MAYINFKEENYKLKIQLEKRKKNNEKNYNYIIKHKKEMTDYSPDNRYSYEKIEGEFIGKKGTLDEIDFHNIENKDILCASFKDCTFANVKFINCKIIGCKFYDCKFIHGGVIFENCIFIMDDSIQSPSLNNETNYSCEFYNCEFYSKFKNSDLSYAIFENCLIRNTFFEICMMKSTIFNTCELSKIKIGDCDLSGFKTHKCYIKDFEFDDKFRTKVDEKTFFDKLVIRKKDRDEYEGTYMIYETIADKFKENTLDNNFGEYYFLCKKMEYKTLDPLPKMSSFIYRVSCGYGERPFNALFLGLFIMIAFSLIYLFIGLKIDDKYVIYSLSNLKNTDNMVILDHFNKSLTLSTGTFLGVDGYSAEPINISLLISDIEMILGVIISGIGIGAFIRKIIR